MGQWVKVWVAVTTVRAVTHAFASLDSGASCKKETAIFTADYAAAQQSDCFAFAVKTSLHSVVKNS